MRIILNQGQRNANNSQSAVEMRITRTLGSSLKTFLVGSSLKTFLVGSSLKTFLVGSIAKSKILFNSMIF